ncbi:MAG: ROK family protein [Oscillospiraceae bacterium]
MHITDSFIESGLVKVAGKGVSRGGKRPEVLRVIPEARYFAGVDMSDSCVTCVIIDLKGRSIIKNSAAIDSNDTSQIDVVERSIALLKETISDSHIERSRLFGIGVGVPGITNPETGIASSQSLQIYDYDMGLAFNRVFSVPIFVDNTAKVTAIAEKWYGSGQNEESFIMLAFGRGIGSAMIVNGDIYRGCHNMSGEVGHTVVNVNGPLCRCGKRGCLEVLASNSAIEKQARGMLRDGFKSSMLEMAGGEIENVTVRVVMEAAEHGDHIALMIAEEAIKYIVVGIENVVSLFDINFIIVTGRIFRKSAWLLNQLTNRLKDTCGRYHGGEEIELVLAGLGNDAAAIGAATLPLRSFVDNQD